MGAQTDRLVRIESLLRRKRQVTFQDLLNELEASPATVKRDLAYLRDRLGCPVVYDRGDNTYRIDESPQVGERREIPGLWFNGKELHALLTAHQLLSGLDPNGALNRHVTPLLERLHSLVGQNERDKIDVMQRVRVVSAGNRERTSCIAPASETTSVRTACNAAKAALGEVYAALGAPGSTRERCSHCGHAKVPRPQLPVIFTERTPGQ